MGLPVLTISLDYSQSPTVHFAFLQIKKDSPARPFYPTIDFHVGRNSLGEIWMKGRWTFMRGEGFISIVGENGCYQ